MAPGVATICPTGKRATVMLSTANIKNFLAQAVRMAAAN
jgi:hypothetical protein